MKKGDLYVVDKSFRYDGFEIEEGWAFKILYAKFSMIGCEFENFVGKHSCGSQGKSGHCWNITSELVKNNCSLFKSREPDWRL